MSLEHMQNVILENTLQLVSKKDVLFCLGDMAFTLSGLQLLREIPARKILVRGNHDTLPTLDYLTVFDEVEGAYRYKNCFLTHIPIHETELYRGGNIHGHCHRGGPRETRSGDLWAHYFNAILEFNDYRPVQMQHALRVLRDG